MALPHNPNPSLTNTKSENTLYNIGSSVNPVTPSNWATNPELESYNHHYPLNVFHQPAQRQEITICTLSDRTTVNYLSQQSGCSNRPRRRPVSGTYIIRLRLLTRYRTPYRIPGLHSNFFFMVAASVSCKPVLIQTERSHRVF